MQWPYLLLIVFVAFVALACFCRWLLEERHDGDRHQGGEGYSLTSARMDVLLRILKLSEAPVRRKKIMGNLELVLKPLGISEQSGQSGQSGESEICAICLDAGPGFRKLQCNHAFHLDCIKAWCREQMQKEENFESIQCPICRSQHQIPLEPQSDDVESTTVPVKLQL
mmetsp:Transcript_50323/g.80383  ORF Transcript_50323/g.80383 Transcript_50323/m.80383 type:complete len:168 (-) Transcript_50323:58-561(-)